MKLQDKPSGESAKNQSNHNPSDHIPPAYEAQPTCHLSCRASQCSNGQTHLSGTAKPQLPLLCHQLPYPLSIHHVKSNWTVFKIPLPFYYTGCGGCCCWRRRCCCCGCGCGCCGCCWRRRCCCCGCGCGCCCCCCCCWDFPISPVFWAV